MRMKSEIKIFSLILILFTGISCFWNHSFANNPNQNYRFPTIPQESDIISICKIIESNKLDFYSNEYISFYYPQGWILTQTTSPIGISVSLQVNNSDKEESSSLLIVILDETLTAEEALKFVLKGFFKSFKNYQINNSSKSLFKENKAVYKTIEITDYTFTIHGEAYSFNKSGKTFAFIKLSNNKNKLTKTFSDIEDSFEVLSYKFQRPDSILVDINEKEKLARQGDKLSQAFLGYAYLTGKGAHIDYERAFYWNKKLAESGYAGAMYLLGYQYIEGLGTKKDLAKGNYWKSEAIKNGHIEESVNKEK